MANIFIKILQINLEHGKNATAELGRNVTREQQTNIALI